MAAHARKQTRLSRVEERMDAENRRHRRTLVSLKERYDALLAEERERHEAEVRRIREDASS